MPQITFTIPDDETARKILSAISKITPVYEIHVSGADTDIVGQIIPAEKTLVSVENMLADWTDMKESIGDFRRKLWESPSF